MAMDSKAQAQKQDAAARRLTLATILGSVLMATALLLVYARSGSQLALAQAADSAFDMIGGLALLWALHVSTRPADTEHPQGHSLAQPVAALIVAVLAGVLSAEVLRSALAALLTDSNPVLDGSVAAVFAAKVMFKAVVVMLARLSLRGRRSPALSALQMDARNDSLVGSLALLGLGLVRAGLPRVDAALAVGLAGYITYAGLQLGRENISLLLGESASVARLQQLTALACGTPGVKSASALIAIWRGARLHIQLSAAVDSSLTLRSAHDIGHLVEQRLLLEPDVGHVIVHIEPV